MAVAQPDWLTEIWRSHTLASGQAAHWRCGALELILCRHGNDWLARSAVRPEAAFSEQEIECSDEEPDDSAGAQRWAFDRTIDRFAVRPVMPDRPVVVRPYDPLHLPRDSEVVFYVSIPLWMEVSVHPEEGEAVPLRAFPSLSISSIWFGDPMAGILCYSLKTRARRELEGGVVVAHRAVCPVTIRNSSTSTLPIEKFCLHVAHLGVFASAERLWAHPVRLHHIDAGRPARIEFSDAPPVKDAVVLSPPAQKVEGGLLKRTLMSDVFRLF